MLAFVLPMFNEEKHIGGVLAAIKAQAGHLPHEVVVVDNGSTDRSPEIAAEMGAACFRRPDLNLSEMRNFGVQQTRGEILIFLDSDIYLQAGWRDSIGGVLQELEKDELLVTGSHYGISLTPTWIERYWFAPFVAAPDTTHLGSGHLIVRRSFFHKIGGFPVDLETGEDYEFCRRAVRCGGRIVNNRDLDVVHEGYPKSLRAFFRRERWHGRGDAKSLRTVLASKPALVSACLCVVLAASLAAAWFSPLWPVLGIGFALAVCILSAWYRCRSFGRNFWVNIYLFAVYYTARACSIIDCMLGIGSRRKRVDYQKGT